MKQVKHEDLQAGKKYFIEVELEYIDVMNEEDFDGFPYKIRSENSQINCFVTDETVFYQDGSSE